MTIEVLDGTGKVLTILDNAGRIVARYPEEGGKVDQLVLKNAKLPLLQNYMLRLGKSTGDDKNAGAYYVEIFPRQEGFTERCYIADVEESEIEEASKALVKKVQRLILDARLDQGPLLLTN